MYNFVQFFRRDTWYKFASARIVDYSLCLEPYGSKVSSIEVKGRLTIDEGAFAIIESYAFVVKSCISTGDKETTVLGLSPFYTLFDRDIVYTARSSISEQIRHDILNHFKNCSDAHYSMSYIDVSSTGDELTYLAPGVDETGRYNLKEYLELVADRILVSYTLSGSGVALSITQRNFIPTTDAPPSVPTTEEKIPIYDTTITKDVLISATFTNDLISKITHYDPVLHTATDYYLLADGTITTNGSDSNRVDGRWIVYTASNVNEGLIAAQFARSRYSHSIDVIVTGAEQHRTHPNYFCMCKIKLRNGEVIESRVTGILETSRQNAVTQITAGLAITKLSEIVREVRNASH